MKQGDKVLQKQKNKNEERERNNVKYQLRRDKEFEKREIRMMKKAEENKVKYKEILEEQIRDKEKRMEEEKQFFRHQAVVWGMDEKLYGQIADQRKKDQIENVRRYKEDLDQQIKIKQEINNQRESQNSNPNQIKEELIDKIKELEYKKNTIN